MLCAHSDGEDAKPGGGHEEQGRERGRERKIERGGERERESREQNLKGKFASIRSLDLGSGRCYARIAMTRMQNLGAGARGAREGRESERERERQRAGDKIKKANSPVSCPWISGQTQSGL